VLLDDNALAAGVAALLETRGEKDLGAIVRRSIVQVVGRAERWSMGTRDVAAHRISLVVSAADHVWLTSNPRRFATIREAFATAVRSPETEMENLSLVLELPPSRTTFAQGYRDAPVRTFEVPAADAVLAGAAALCRAMGDEASARALSRAGLEDTFDTAYDPPVRRFVLRLDVADFALAEKQMTVTSQLVWAIRSAAATPAKMTTAVIFALRLSDGQRVQDPEKHLVQALERKNAVVVPISRDAERVRFAVVYQEKLAVVEIQHDLSKSSGKTSRSMVLKSTSTKIAEVRLSDQAIKSEDAAESASADVLREMYER
jgi:hypothetical protein